MNLKLTGKIDRELSQTRLNIHREEEFPNRRQKIVHPLAIAAVIHLFIRA